MGLRIPVIINSVNNLSDARYAAGMGVEWMGFQVDEQADRYVSPELFKAITSWVSGIRTVAEIKELNPVSLQRIIELYQPDFIQYEHLLNLTDADLKDFNCIIKIAGNTGNEKSVLDSLSNETLLADNFILLEFSDWTDWRSHTSEIKGNAHFKHIIWALPVDKTDMPLINDLNINGLSLKGGDEQRPGWKDLDQMIDILEALEEN